MSGDDRGGGRTGHGMSEEVQEHIFEFPGTRRQDRPAHGQPYSPSALAKKIGEVLDEAG